MKKSLILKLIIALLGILLAIPSLIVTFDPSSLFKYFIFFVHASIGISFSGIASMLFLLLPLEMIGFSSDYALLMPIDKFLIVVFNGLIYFIFAHFLLKILEKRTTLRVTSGILFILLFLGLNFYLAFAVIMMSFST